jgi:SOS response regulatory protein OraA/RecX
MVSMIPEGTPPIDDKIARILLAKGYSAGIIAEFLDAVIEELIDADYRER